MTLPKKYTDTNTGTHKSRTSSPDRLHGRRRYRTTGGLAMRMTLNRSTYAMPPAVRWPT